MKYIFSVRTKNRDTAVSAKIIFMVMDMTAIILILVGINHANIETAHVTLSPIQFGCFFFLQTYGPYDMDQLIIT